MRKLGSLLLLSVVAVSLFALMGFIKPAQAGAGSHQITAVYYKAYVHDDHDGFLAGAGEWRFGLESAVQGYTWTGEISVDGARMVDFSDRSRSWSITGNTWFRCRAEEYDGILWLDVLDYYSWVQVPVSFPGPSVNTWHSGSHKAGDVTHYYKYYIQNLAPTADPIDDRFVPVGVPVSFSGSGSDPEGDSLSYEWDFGDSETSTEQNPTHTYADDGTYTVSFRVKDSLGTYSSYKYATVTVTHVIIDQTFVSDNRADVSSVQTVGFHAKWAHNDSDIVGGSIKVGGVEYVTNGTGWISFTTTSDTVGKSEWTITYVSCSGITLYETIADDPYIIWDRVSINLIIDDTRINIGSTASITLTGTHEYDDSEFAGTATFNDTLTKNVVGKYWYTINAISDLTYGLTAFEANSVYCIFDRVQMMLSVLDNRINVGDTAALSWTGTYVYDGSTFEGSITYNDTLTKTIVGKHGYKVASITDPAYGLTKFTTNEVYVIFDKVTVTLSAIDDTIEVGSTASITQTAVYQYDGTDFDGTKTLNDTSTKSTVGTYYYTTKSISGDTHGITVFESNTIPITFADTTAPVADAGNDQTVTEDTSVSFDASGSTDNVAIVSYEWDFRDETTGTNKTTTHTYTESGTYNVTLTVKDAAGNSDTDSITITVEATPVTFPLWIIGVVIAVIVAGIIVTALLLQRRGRAAKGQ